MAYINITQDNFQAAVLENKNTVLLDFWASWCGPCKMLAPIVEEIAEEYSDVTLGKINVDEQMELAIQFGIVSIPTLIVYRDGKEVAKSIGYCSKADVLKLLGK
jgi:thioredoxin 1